MNRNNPLDGARSLAKDEKDLREKLAKELHKRSRDGARTPFDELTEKERERLLEEADQELQWRRKKLLIKAFDD